MSNHLYTRTDMPPNLPIISGATCIRALKTFGYEVARQRGSHARLVCPGRSPVTVPMHKELKRGTLRAILRTTEIDVVEFLARL